MKLGQLVKVDIPNHNGHGYIIAIDLKDNYFKYAVSKRCCFKYAVSKRCCFKNINYLINHYPYPNVIKSSSSLMLQYDYVWVTEDEIKSIS